MAGICKVCGNKLDPESGQCLKCYLESVKRGNAGGANRGSGYNGGHGGGNGYSGGRGGFTSVGGGAEAPVIPHNNGEAETEPEKKSESNPLYAVLVVGALLVGIFLILKSAGMLEDWPNLGSYHCVWCQTQGFGLYYTGNIWGVSADLCWDCVQLFR